MKKVLSFLLIAVILVFGYRVYAIDYKVDVLIPINDTATVDTKSFTYKDISYTSVVEGKQYGRFNFANVTNKTAKSLPLSINILLFDNNKKNIGYLTYCSEKDYESDYSQFELKSNSESALYINVSNKYLVENKSSSDIAYYAVHGDNSYCQIGGYSNYKGLTIEEISSFNDTNLPTRRQSILDFVTSVDFTSLIKFFAIIMVYNVITGYFLNALYKRKETNVSPLSYFPIGNNYISVKLAFGDLLAKCYLFILFISIVLYIISIARFLLYILLFITFAAFIVDIIKLITKKYDILIFNPKTSNFVSNDLYNNSNNAEFSGDNTSFISSDNSDNINDDIINLNYDNNVDNNGIISAENNVNSPIQKDDNSSKEESDLMDLFR